MTAFINNKGTIENYHSLEDAVQLMTTLFIDNKEAVFLETTKYANGNHSICIKDRQGKIIRSLKCQVQISLALDEQNVTIDG